MTKKIKELVAAGHALAKELHCAESAALVAKIKTQEQRMAPGLDGGVVMFGQRTSKMTIPQMVEVIEAIYWFGTQQGVTFSEQSRNEIEWAKRWGESNAK